LQEGTAKVKIVIDVEDKHYEDAAEVPLDDLQALMKKLLVHVINFSKYLLMYCLSLRAFLKFDFPAFSLAS
jgi:hypothetical protein